MNKKRVLLLFVVLSLLCFLFSCSGEDKNGVVNRDYNTAEVEEAAKLLVEKSIPLNEILFGSGLGYDIEGEGNGIYKKATAQSLEKYGISSVEDIKLKLSEVFSTIYIEKNIDVTDIFSSKYDGENIMFYSRYYDDVDEDGNTYIYVNSVYEYELKNKYEYISEPRAVGSVGELVILKATVRATIDSDNGEAPKTRDIEHEIKLIEENGSWRLYSFTHVVYDEYRDIYENLK